MEALPKQPQGVAIEEGRGEEQRNQTGNEEQEDSRCSLSSTEIIKEREPCSSISGTCSSCSSLEVDLEYGVVESRPNLGKEMERDCRICHLTLDPTSHESGVPIELGCSCKDDLAAAHKHCAEAWFKIKGNRTCEICGSTAKNVVAAAIDADATEPWSIAATATAPTTVHATETRNFWQAHRFLNFLLACMVFAFVISWLFHFNVPS